MSDVTRRLSRWKAKYSPEIAAQTTARIYADMTERYQASMVALCEIEVEGLPRGGSLPSPSTNSSLLTATCSSPRLCPATLQALARPYHLRPDAGEGGPGAA